MYYKEELINGVWHYKVFTNGKWHKMNAVQLTNKIASLERQIKALTPTAVVQVKPEVCDEDGMTKEEVQTWKDWYEMYSPRQHK